MPTYFRYAREKPAWLPMLVFGRLLAARRLERMMKGAGLRRLEFRGTSRIGVGEIGKVIPDLASEGVAQGLSLSSEDTIEIRKFAETSTCKTRDMETVEFYPRDIDSINERRSRDILAAYYFEKVEDCPTIVAVREDPLISAIATSYIGQPALPIRTRLWWSFPARRITDYDLHAVAQDKFHFDMNDWRTIKFFFYLTDTDDESGAHSYISRSHIDRRFRHQFTLMVGHDEADLRREYGADRVQIVTGHAGAGFAEDPFVFHTGRRCHTRPRLLLELEYGAREHSESYRYGIYG